MFDNKRRILDLECSLSSLVDDVGRANEKYWELRHDIDAIAKHLGVKFEDINKRVIVKTDTPQSEP